MNICEEAQTVPQEILTICGKYLQGPWKRIPLKEFKLREIKGGLSSGLGLYRCSLPESIPYETNTIDKNIPWDVVVRFNNRNLHSDDEIVEETIIFSILSEKDIGPKLFGVFPEGRIEQYIPSRSADWNDFSEIYISVAKEMAKVHSLQMPIKKIPVFLERTHQWLNDFEKICKAKAAEIPDFISNGEFRNEIAWITKEIEKINPKVTFCHNDLQGGNILILSDSHGDSSKTVKFIDYEYAGYNYRCFDIANYFWAACFHINIEEKPLKWVGDMEKYPSKAKQEEFMKAYINQQHETNITFKDSRENEEELQKILKEFQIMKFAPFLYWLAFAVNESLNPRVEISFMDTAKMIWILYKDLKMKDKNE